MKGFLRGIVLCAFLSCTPLVGMSTARSLLTRSSNDPLLVAAWVISAAGWAVNVAGSIVVLPAVAAGFGKCASFVGTGLGLLFHPGNRCCRKNPTKAEIWEV